jgi:hypothetical protein
MIEITVTGDTYHIRKGLKDNGFRWNRIDHTWHKREDEESLNHTLDKITPFADRELTIRIRLVKVDRYGNPLSPIVRFCLSDVARPGVSALGIFNKEISVSCVSPIRASSPTKHKTKEWKKLPRIDEGFF